jgi:hypothetical protein
MGRDRLQERGSEALVKVKKKKYRVFESFVKSNFFKGRLKTEDRENFFISKNPLL